MPSVLIDFSSGQADNPNQIYSQIGWAVTNRRVKSFLEALTKPDFKMRNRFAGLFE
jgi:hypothetical protein